VKSIDSRPQGRFKQFRIHVLVPTPSCSQQDMGNAVLFNIPNNFFAKFRQFFGSSENLVAEPYGEVEVPEEEEDARAVVLERSKTTRGGFELVDFAVEAFAQGVGQKADEVVE
jgi:hypothetical protein